MRLMSHGQVARGTFLDFHNLLDLSLLISIVGEETEMLIVLCPEEILYRSRCAGEMSTARLHNIESVLVLIPCF